MAKWAPKTAYFVSRTDGKDHAITLPSGAVAAFGQAVWYVPLAERDDLFLEDEVANMEGNPLFVTKTKGVVVSEGRYLPAPDKPPKED